MVRKIKRPELLFICQKIRVKEVNGFRFLDCEPNSELVIACEVCRKRNDLATKRFASAGESCHFCGTENQPVGTTEDTLEMMTAEYLKRQAETWG